MKKRHFLKSAFVSLLISMFIVSSSTGVFAVDTEKKWNQRSSMINPSWEFSSELLNGKIYAIGDTASVQCYNPLTDQWTMEASMSTARAVLQTAVISGNIYAIGGANTVDGVYDLNSVEKYDPISNAWETKAPMVNGRRIFQTEVIGNKLYSIGGFDKENVLSSLEEYDSTTDKWITKASMSTPRKCLRTEVVNGKIYAIGGENLTGYLSSAEKYDPDTNQWTATASMSVPRTYFSTEVINGKIYAIGGKSNNIDLSSVEVYDPDTNKWTTKASMSTPRNRFQTEVIGGKIYAIGGKRGDTNDAILSSVEAYDPATDKWEQMPSMSVPRYFFQTSVVNGKLYAFGGGSKGPALSSVEEYDPSSNPTLTVTASPNKVKVGEQFSTDVAIHNVTNICAEDIKISYDTDLFEYEGAEAQTGLQIYKEDTSIPGTVRFIVASQGKDNAATGDKGLITLKFRAKSMGTGKVDITHGRIADNATLETDVADEDCGEDSITVDGYADVNKNGEFTLLDLGIDAYYNGMNASDTDQEKYNTDVVEDGIIDDNDLQAITQGILSNRNYGPNNS